MMEESGRGPCPRCGEPVSLTAHACPHCKGNLLVDVSLEDAPADGRTRYQIARGLSSLGPPAPSFAAAQQAVAIPHSVLVSGATRDLAQRVLALVEEHGGRGRMTPAVKDVPVPDEAPGSRFSSVLVIMIVAAVVGFGLWAWTRRLGGESGGDEIELPTRAAHVAALGPTLSTETLSGRLKPATVALRCRSSAGSGFFVAEDLVLTQAHALCPSGEPLLAVLADGREIAAAPGQRDDGLDLALVQVPGAKVPPLPLGDATALRKGDHVVFLDTPGGLDATAYEGVVSQQARNVFGLAFLQVDTQGSSGNSGGPLLDTHGRVVGVVSTRGASKGMGFVLPINYVYSGSRRLIPPPVLPPPDDKTWNKLLADVMAAERREAQRAEMGPPALLQLVTTPGQGSVAVVARRAVGLPQKETLTFSFRTGDRTLCQATSAGVSWSKADLAAADAPGASSQYMQWAKKNGLEKDVYVGSAPLDLQACPLEELHGSDLVLENGDGRADRVAVP
jgi:serine protease Do